MSQKRILILVDCLSSGGAEKSAATLSHLLHHEQEYQVYMMTIRDEVVYNYSGILINIGTNKSKFKPIKQWQKLLHIKKEVSRLQPIYIIDFRMRNRKLMEFMLYQYVFRFYNMIYTVRNHHIPYHLPSGNFFKKVYRKATVVGVSKAISKTMKTQYGIDNVHYIPNAVDKTILEQKAAEKTIEGNYIIAVGRLNNKVKQFDKLIKTYASSKLPNVGIQLKILGDGTDKSSLQRLIKELGLADKVELIGFVNNPYSYMKNAKFLVLCSVHEGFPRVILEALTLKTPVVSFNCKSGPSEMIQSGNNGILVEDQNFEALKDTIDELANNSELLQKMKTYTNSHLEKYSPESHINYWKQLLK